MTERWLITYSYVCNMLTSTGELHKLSESVGYKVIHGEPVEWFVEKKHNYEKWLISHREGKLVYCADDCSDVFDDINYILCSIPVPVGLDVAALG